MRGICFLAPFSSHFQSPFFSCQNTRHKKADRSTVAGPLKNSSLGRGGGDVCVMRHLSSSSHLSNYLGYMVKPLPVGPPVSFLTLFKNLQRTGHPHQKLERQTYCIISFSLCECQREWNLPGAEEWSTLCCFFPEMKREKPITVKGLLDNGTEEESDSTTHFQLSTPNTMIINQRASKVEKKDQFQKSHV